MVGSNCLEKNAVDLEMLFIWIIMWTLLKIIIKVFVYMSILLHVQYQYVLLTKRSEEGNIAELELFHTPIWVLGIIISLQEQ